MAINRRDSGTSYLPLRDAIDRLFAGSVISPSLLSGSLEGWPPTDIYMTDDDVIIQMAIPGANPNDINISVTGDTVSITGHVSQQFGAPSGQSGQGQSGQSGQQGQSATGKSTQTQSSQGQTSQHHGPQPLVEEIFRGRFQRTFTLPIQVEPNKASASFENGILTLKLPKSESTKPRRIQVQSGNTLQGQTQGQQSGTQTETVPVHAGSKSGSSSS